MIKPGDILLYTGAGLLAWLLFRGARSQTKIWQESEEKQSQKKASDEVKRKAKEFQLSWKDSSGKTRTANLDTMAKFLEAALRGSWWGEDEDQIKAVMNAIPVSIKGKSGVSYPIVTIAARYAINTGGKDLKADLVRLLSQSELQSLGVLKHLKYL